jgi:ATP-dependent helicase HrpB
LPAFAPAEILAADLAGLLLDLAAWGTRDPKDLAWLDPPPAAATTEARALLRELGALDLEGAITARGKAMRKLPLPPRLARMALRAQTFGAGEQACELAVLLTERGLGGDSTDLGERLDRWARDPGARAKDARRLAQGWKHGLREAARTLDEDNEDKRPLSPGALAALAFPDRIARARGKAGDFLMANGRAASLEPHLALAREKYLAIAEVTGRAGATRILAAAALDADDFESLFAHEIETSAEIRFDAASGALRRRETRRYHALTLAERTLPLAGSPEEAGRLARGAAEKGVERLNWSKAQTQLRERVAFLRQAFARTAREGEANPWPDLSDAGLAQAPALWLAPYIEGCGKLDDIGPDQLDAALSALIPWDLQRRLDMEAPTHFLTPAGSSIALDYSSAEGPGLAVRVQELYGLAEHPSLAGGRVPLTLHLLSPAHRPIQITRDLPGFWRGSWSAVKAEMKGRYPRHPWPDDPAGAAPTTRAKPRGT